MSSQWSAASASSLPASSPSSISQDLLLLEKKRKAKEEAVRDLNNGGNGDLRAIQRSAMTDEGHLARPEYESNIRANTPPLLEETLTRLRSKAQQLQDDKWMYQDVQL